jgi:ribonuclease Z
VRAVELDHTVPTVGWVLEEEVRPGRLQAKHVLPILEQHGIPRSVLRSFKMGTPIPLPDGSELKPADFVDKGTSRKLVILSDTRELELSSSAAVHAAGADLLIHEATNAWTEEDRRKGLSERDVHRSTRQHGHSTPQVAGAFARGVGAKNLVLTHFSSRYCPTHRPVMNEILSFAQKAFKGRVTAATDLMQILVNIDGTVRVVEAPPSRARRYIQSFEELRAEREREELEASEEHATV